MCAQWHSSDLRRHRRQRHRRPHRRDAATATQAPATLSSAI